MFKNVPVKGLLEEHIQTLLYREYGEEKGDKLFTRAVTKGFLYQYKKDYGIPIPSMQD